MRRASRAEPGTFGPARKAHGPDARCDHRPVRPRWRSFGNAVNGRRAQVATPEDYYATAFHDCGQSAGYCSCRPAEGGYKHSSHSQRTITERVGRSGCERPDRFGVAVRSRPTCGDGDQKLLFGARSALVIGWPFRRGCARSRASHPAPAAAVEAVGRCVGVIPAGLGGEQPHGRRQDRDKGQAHHDGADDGHRRPRQVGHPRIGQRLRDNDGRRSTGRRAEHDPGKVDDQGLPDRHRQQLASCGTDTAEQPDRPSPFDGCHDEGVDEGDRGEQGDQPQKSVVLIVLLGRVLLRLGVYDTSAGNVEAGEAGGEPSSSFERVVCASPGAPRTRTSAIVVDPKCPPPTAPAGTRASAKPSECE